MSAPSRRMNECREVCSGGARSVTNYVRISRIRGSKPSMSRWRAWLVHPGPEADPRENLRYSRRMEVFSGMLGVIGGLATWSDGWWHWLILGGGVLALS